MQSGKVKWIKDNIVFCVFFCVMACYYVLHLFVQKPWYDELYTYYSFISRGPVYAAIHWPVPNNHVFYSVLSALFDFSGNAYIGLRGVSYLAAMINLILLYLFAGKYMKKGFAAGCTMLYSALYLVNSLAVQGRGYTLATTCYLTSLLCLFQICTNEAKKKDYIIFAVALTAGLYTLVSSTFWVIPICIFGGLFLLSKREYQKLFRLIAASMAAALMTLFLYTLIWLAIGSNLLCKNPDSIYYGIYQMTIILKAPFLALSTGMEYMLSTPYIQSIERLDVIRGLFSYLSNLFTLYIQGMGEGITVLLGVGAVLFAGIAVKRYQNKKEYFAALYISISFILLPLMLIIQSVTPYFRVFSYFAAVFSFFVLYILSLFTKECFQEKRQTAVMYLLSGLLGVFTLLMLVSPAFNEQLAGRENQIVKIISKEDTKQFQSIYYADDFQKYVFKFYYDFEPVETTVEEANCILLPREILDASYEQAEWPILSAHDGLNFKYIDENFKIVKEDNSYIFYLRKNR